MPVFEAQSSLKKQQVRIENLLPEELRETSKKLTEFLKDYYEFLNSEVEKFEFVARLVKDPENDLIGNIFKTDVVELVSGNTEFLQPGLTLRIINEPGSFIVGEIKEILTDTTFRLKEKIDYSVDQDFEIIRIVDPLLSDLFVGNQIFRVEQAITTELDVITSDIISEVVSEANQGSTIIYIKKDSGLETGNRVGILGEIYRLQSEPISRNRDIFPEQFSFFVVSPHDPSNDVIGNPGFIINKIQNLRDVDTAEQSIFNRIQAEVSRTIPEFFSTNRKKTFKFSQNLYNIRGGEKSVEEFFKFFFNEPNVFVEYPYEKTLKPSSGNFDRVSNRYINQTGFLSNIDKLHDSFFYQRYSYVVRTPIERSQWEKPFERLIHPSGIKYFVEFFLEIIGRNLRTKMPRLQPVYVIRSLDLFEIIFKEFNSQKFDTIQDEIEFLVITGLSRLVLDVRPETNAIVVNAKKGFLLFENPLLETVESNDTLNIFNENDDLVASIVVKNVSSSGFKTTISFDSIEFASDYSELDPKDIFYIRFDDTNQTLVYELNLDTQGIPEEIVEYFLKKNTLKLLTKEFELKLIRMIKGQLNKNTNDQNKFLSNNEIQLFYDNTLEQGINNLLSITIGTKINTY